MKSNDELILAEAAAWVDWTSRPDAEPQKADAFERWMEADAAHRAAFADLSALWRSDALGEAAEDIALGVGRPPRRAFAWQAMVPVGLTASAVLAVVGLFAPLADYRTLETGRAETRDVTLADGTLVRMSGHSRLKVRQSLVRRSATLENGEVFFDVRPGGRNFVVDSPEGQVRVTGTAFNVDRSTTGRTEVSLYRGAVRVSDRAGGAAGLAPGDRAVMGQGRFRYTPASNRGAVSDTPDWLNGWFDTHDASLARLVEELDRFSTTPIVIDETASGMRISGRFHVAEPARVLEVMRVAYGVEVERRPDSILIRRRAAS